MNATAGVGELAVYLWKIREGSNLHMEIALITSE